MHQKAITFGAVIAALLLLTAGYLSLAGAGDTPQDDYTIQLTGSPGTTVNGNCTIDTANGPVVKDFTGAANRTEHVTGTGVSCQLLKQQNDGSVKLVISQDGNILSETESAGSTTQINASVS